MTLQAGLLRGHHLDRPLASGLDIEGLRVAWRHARNLGAPGPRRGDAVRQVGVFVGPRTGTVLMIVFPGSVTVRVTVVVPLAYELR